MFKSFQKRQIFNRKSYRFRINKIIFTAKRTNIFIRLNRKKITSKFMQIFKIFSSQRRNNYFIHNIYFFVLQCKDKV